MILFSDWRLHRTAKHTARISERENQWSEDDAEWTEISEGIQEEKGTDAERIRWSKYYSIE